MNVIKNKIFGYSKFQDAEEIPRLNFNVKFSRSAYQGEKLHPALEALLYYIYTEGRMDPLCPFAFNNADEMRIKILLAKLKSGGWKSLDEKIISPVIAMAAIQEYLKSLPKSLWSSTQPEDWKTLAKILRDRDQSTDIESKSMYNSRMEALKIFKNFTPDVRNFSAKLLMTLHEVMIHCDEDLQAAAAHRLSEFFAEALIKNPEKIINQTPMTFQFCVAYLIEEAPFVFGSEDALIQPSPNTTYKSTNSL
ncbi:uncharacterized protein CDAR_54661 [Caerostris darwini]|uniref:Rho-GAP domain-containing protein n=1 Tax=Caerostris darwini TaxID=1538125 RepID=A0AAV4RZA0_9ARAC|nr:uncharacterized protein CDAR_54661 [Caerostris darwini]